MKLLCLFSAAIEELVVKTEERSQIQKIEEGIVSVEDHERQAALSTILELVKSHSMSRRMPQKIMGTLLGGLLPRCADRSLAVQQTALDTIYRLLTIQLSDQGVSLEQQEETIGVLKTLHETLNPNAQREQVAEVVSKCVPHDQLDTLLLMVFDYLADEDQNCANMAAQLVETILTYHHQDLQDKVSEIIDVLWVHFLFIPYQEVKRQVWRGITILTSHSSTAAVNHQLTCHIPGEESIKDVRRAAPEDTDCAVSTLKHLGNSLQRKSCPISGNVYSTITSLVAIVGVYDIITQPEMEVVSTLFPLIFKGLLVSLTSYVNFSLDPSEERGFTAEFDSETSRLLNENCVRSLKALFDQPGQSDICGEMVENGGWHKMVGVTFDKGVVLLASAMTAHTSCYLGHIVHQLARQIFGLQDNQAVPVIIFFGELLKAPYLSVLGLRDTVVNTLVKYLWYYSSPVTQFLCVKALENLNFGERRLSWSVTDTLVGLLGMKGDPVLTLGVLSCLQKNILEAPAETIQPFLDAILTRIQPLFGAESEQVQAAAFRMLGVLTKFVGSSNLQQQIHANLMCMLLHLGGKSEEVINSCAFTLCTSFSLIGSAKACSLLEKYAEEPSWTYLDFLRRVSRQLVHDFPSMMNLYAMQCASLHNHAHLRDHALALSTFLVKRTDRFGLARCFSWWKAFITNCCCPAPNEPSVQQPLILS
ncbi:maestro heat-like repeat-containing protein family member 1 [Scyliorhinus canicula]|uniref:maestro heat-like repeat-containing protein family member 1 n=1 Tax=Scyliorhinus canicula TaxID=7830 RepID=UPI0018F452F0|nr:maestro heat-like repeat-containing protein family member 1 [Scyliorhinus canicula]